MKKTAYQPWAAALVTVLLWASAFPMIKLALHDFSPVPLAALRFAVAGITLIVLLGINNPARPATAGAEIYTPKIFLRLGLAALMGIAGYNVLLNTGQQTINAGAASFIVNTVPVFTVILGASLLKERFTFWAWVGMCISFSGVALISSTQPGGLSFGAGAFWVLGAAICQAAFFVTQKPLVSLLGPLRTTAIVVIAGALWLSPWLPHAIAEARDASWTSLATVAYLGIFPAAAGYATWSYAQAHFGASRAANFLYLVPPVAVAIAWVTSAETPSTLTAIGGVLAILGVGVINSRGRG
jgi:drug/metabolite transporter (DMT)-like permease